MTPHQLQVLAEDLAREKFASLAERVDTERLWPKEQLQALGESGLLGLHVPRRLGGLEQGLLALSLVTEALGRVCSSTSMCYGMHCVGTAVIVAKATPHHEEYFLKPIAEGRHVTSLGLSESGSGANFYMPEAILEREKDFFSMEGTKSFVTSGGFADSYVLSGKMADKTNEIGEFICLVVEAGTSGMNWGEPWQGLGMHGNASRDLRLHEAKVPVQNLLGEEGDQIWYVFEIVAPYFIMAMSGTYLGIAQSCLDISLQTLRERRHSHTGEALADMTLLQSQVAELWIKVERTRQLVHEAARMGDRGDPKAISMLFGAKADVAEMVVDVANEAMTLCGGRAYAANSRLARLLRDARASHVMAPTTQMLKVWLGRNLLGLPIL